MRPYCKNIFKILCFQRKLGNKSHNLTYCFSVHSVIIYISSENKCLSGNIVRVSDQLLIPPWYSFCMISQEQRSHLSSNTCTNKNHVENFFGFRVKSSGGSEKDRYQDHIMIGGICSLI